MELKEDELVLENMLEVILQSLKLALHKYTIVVGIGDAKTVETVQVIFFTARVFHIIENNKVYVTNLKGIIFRTKFTAEHVKGVAINRILSKAQILLVL